MAKKTIVISLGGSIIIPDKINTRVLREFRRIILKNTKKYKFIIVCGGGKTARNYIKGLENEEIKQKEFFECLLGISATRLNARFMTYFFGRDANSGMPHDMKDIVNLLNKHDIVFCGALRYAKNETSDSTSAKLARYFNTDFINLTDIAGLYEKDPKRYKSALFIPEISHKKFYKIAKKIRFKPGQHFVLDAKAAKIIKKYNITTYLLGPEMKNLDNLLNNRHFTGTVIEK
jgi:uridylate kinase